MGEELVVIRCESSVLADAVETAALGGDGEELHQQMFVDITAAGIETPASGVDADQRSYCTFSPDLFDSFNVAEPIAALFPVAAVLEWIEWLDDTAPITLRFVADPGAEMATQLRLADERSTVVLDCTAEPSLLGEIDTSLPSQFDGETFLDESGDPVPTRIETKAAELCRLVGAVSRCNGGNYYPITVTGGELLFGVTDDRTQVEGKLDATVDGPGFARQYGPEFGQIIQALDGEVTLWTGPDQPLAIVTTEPGAIYRYVVTGH